MKKRTLFFILFLILIIVTFFCIVNAEITPPMPTDDLQKVQDIANQAPIDAQGNLDNEKLIGWKSQAELRIEAINKYVGPITNALFGVELSLSWLFVFAFVIWIEMAEFFLYPFNKIFNLNILLSLLGGFVVSTIIMRGVGKNLAIWLDTLLNVWWSALLAVVLSLVFFIFIYPLIFNKIEEYKEKLKKEREEQDRKKLHRFSTATENAMEDLNKD